MIFRFSGKRNIIFTDHIWDKLFKSGLSKFCGRQPLKNLKGYDLLKQIIISFPSKKENNISAKRSTIYVDNTGNIILIS